MRIALKLTAALFFGILTACVLDLAFSMLLGGSAAGLDASEGLRAAAVADGRLAALIFLVAAPLVGYTALRLVALERARAEERSERREEAIDRLRQTERLSTVGRLASNLAHELGTPLNVVSGRAMMIAAGEVTGDEAVESAKAIVEQANKMTAYIRQTLAAARRPRAKGAPAEVQATIEEVVSLFERKAKKSRVQLVIDEPRDPIGLELDGTKLVQVLAHLVTNAIEAMPDGGIVHLGARRETESPGEGMSAVGANVAPEVRSTQRLVRIYVRDQGAGIAKDDRQAIFKPFFTTKGEADGTGLGLSIAQGIVREQGGWIDVESELGVGSCFNVRLPEGGS